MRATDRIGTDADVVVPFSCFHQHVVRIPDHDRIRDGLARRGIQTGIHYPIPCHLQGPYTAYTPDPLPAAERAAGEILSLPVFPHITHRQLQHVSDCLNQLVGEAQQGNPAVQ